MIPNVPILTEEITEHKYPDKTYKINVNVGTSATAFSRGVDQSGALLGSMILGNAVLGSTSKPTTVKQYDRISDYVDGVDAVRQAIYLILSTERYKYIIYSWDYGVELCDLIGQPMPYVMSELPRRITEALTQDNRIEKVENFEFEKSGKQLHVTFTVVSTVGNIPTELEVDI